MVMKTFFAIMYDFYYKNENKTDAHFVSMFYLAMLITFNINTLLVALNIYYYPRYNFSFYWSIVLLLFTVATLYFIFIHKKRHLQILHDYKTTSKRRKLLHKTLFFLYIVITITFSFYAATLLRSLNLS